MIVLGRTDEGRGSQGGGGALVVMIAMYCDVNWL